MRTGRRIADPAAKQLAGTYRGDRHANIVETAAPARDEPVMPAYLTPEAKAVWQEEIRRVVGCGAVEADSSLLARYCAVEAEFRTSFMAGEPTKGNILTNLRQMAELLGIAGQRSRLARSVPTTTADTRPSPFKPRNE